MIKRNLLLLVLSIFILSNIALTQSILDYVDYLWEWKDFGYSDETISIIDLNPDATALTIETPVIQDEFGDDINTYVAMYSEYPLSMLIEDSYLLQNDVLETQFDNINTSLSTVPLQLIDGDIDPSKIYYLFLAPKNELGDVGNISNELCFVLDAEIKWDWDDCILMYDNYDESHNAGWADMSLANITHNINKDEITLEWIAVDGSDNVDIYLWKEWADEWELLDTVDMLDEEFSFESENYGSHTVMFRPDNGWLEKTYTLNVLAPTEDKEPDPIPLVPETGPAENIMFIIILSVIVFIGYRAISKRKN